MHYGVFDIETQHSAAEGGGWHRAEQMKISCIVLYDSTAGRFLDFMENQVDRFVEHLQRCELVVGFNIKRFDYQVLKRYTDFSFWNLQNLDILEQVHDCLGFRVSLAALAESTLGESKTAGGLQALRWWQQGRIGDIIEYCRQDVRVTRDLYRFGRDNGHLVYRDKNRNDRFTIAVDWT